MEITIGGMVVAPPGETVMTAPGSVLEIPGATDTTWPGSVVTTAEVTCTGWPPVLEEMGDEGAAPATELEPGRVIVEAGGGSLPLNPPTLAIMEPNDWGLVLVLGPGAKFDFPGSVGSAEVVTGSAGRAVVEVPGSAGGSTALEETGGTATIVEEGGSDPAVEVGGSGIIVETGRSGLFVEVGTNGFKVDECSE